MPRHPPCALHSLSHKHSTKTTTTHHTNPLPNGRPASTTGSHQTTKTNPEHTNTPHNRSRSPSTGPRVRRVCIRVDNRDNPMVSGSSRRCSRPLSSSQKTRPPTTTTRITRTAAKGGPEKTTSTNPMSPLPVGSNDHPAGSLISQSSTVCQDPSASPPTPGSTPHQAPKSTSAAVLRDRQPTNGPHRRRFH